MSTKSLKFNHEIIQQMLTFRVILFTVNLVAWAYYYILLYKQTESFQIIILEALIFAIGIWIGFVAMSFLVDRIGYLQSYRLSMLARAIMAVLVLLAISNLSEYFILIAIARGILVGVYWPVENVIRLKELNSTTRNETFGLSMAIQNLLQIVIPVFVGAFLTYVGSYELIFLVAAFVHIFSIFIPFTHNKKPNSKIRSEEITKILQNKSAPRIILFTVIYEFFNRYMAVTMLFIPYLLLKSEFGVGALTSVVAFLGAIFAYFERKDAKESRRSMFSYIGYAIYSLANIFLVIVWSGPAMFVRGLLNTGSASLYVPNRDALMQKSYDNILQKDEEESAIEMNLIVETAKLVGRVLSLGLLYILLVVFAESNELILKIGIFFVPMGIFGTYIWLERIVRGKDKG